MNGKTQEAPRYCERDVQGCTSVAGGMEAGSDQRGNLVKLAAM